MQDRKRSRRSALIIGSDELLDCLTAAMGHTHFFRSCDEEDCAVEHHKRSRGSTDSDFSLCISLEKQKNDITESKCSELVQDQQPTLRSLKAQRRPVKHHAPHMTKMNASCLV